MGKSVFEIWLWFLVLKLLRSQMKISKQESIVKFQVRISPWRNSANWGKSYHQLNSFIKAEIWKLFLTSSLSAYKHSKKMSKTLPNFFASNDRKNFVTDISPGWIIGQRKLIDSLKLKMQLCLRDVCSRRLWRWLLSDYP